MSKKETELPKDSKGWAEYVRGINYADHKAAMVSLGAAAALGIGAGAVILVKNGKLKIDFADRWFQQKEVISVVETGVDGKVAAGLPMSEEAFERVGKGPELFVMDESGVARPDKNGNVEDKEGTLRKIGNWFVEHFSSQTSPAE